MDLNCKPPTPIEKGEILLSLELVNVRSLLLLLVNTLSSHYHCATLDEENMIDISGAT